MRRQSGSALGCLFFGVWSFLNDLQKKASYSTLYTRKTRTLKGESP